MTHVALRVYALPAMGTCIDRRQGVCPYYRLIGEPGWENPVCALFPTEEAPFTQLVPAEGSWLPQRTDECFRAELDAKHHDMVLRTLSYTSIQQAMSREDPHVRESLNLHEVIIATLRRAIAASEGLVSAAALLGMNRHRLKRLVDKHGLTAEVEAARKGAIKVHRTPYTNTQEEFETPAQGGLE